MAIKFKAERSAERGERAFGAISFGRFQSNVVDFARCASATLTSAMSFADDSQTIGLHGYPYLGDIDGEERAAVFAGKHTAAFDRLSVPAIETKDPISLGDRMPTPNVGELTTVKFTAADMTPV